MGLMTAAVLSTGDLVHVWAAIEVSLPDGHPAVRGSTSTGAALAIAAGLILLSVVGGYYVTRGVLHLAARTGAAEVASSTGSTPPPPPPPPEVSPGAGASSAAANPQADPGPTGRDAVAALRGGTWIGILERLAVTGLIFVGYPGGIAILVAIKGLGRYPELKDNPGASERFVVGTLASIVWAAGLGVLGLWWIG